MHKNIILKNTPKNFLILNFLTRGGWTTQDSCVRQINFESKSVPINLPLT